MGATFFKNTVVLMFFPRCSRFVNCLSIWRRAWTAIVSLRLLLHSARRSVHSNPSSNNFKRLGRGRAAVLHRILPLLPNNHVCEHAQSRPHRMLLGRAGAWMTTRKAGTHLMRTRMTLGALMPVTRQLWTHVHRPRHHHHHFHRRLRKCDRCAFARNQPLHGTNHPRVTVCAFAYLRDVWDENSARL